MVAGLADLVLQASTGTGVGNLTLTTLAGKRAFSDAFGTGSTHDVFYYFISHGSAQEWEVGTGHMSDATTLVRDTIIASSNANAAVNFSAGYKYVGNDLPAAVQILVGNGTVFGPGTVTAGHLATYANGTGNALADGGKAGAIANLDTLTAKYLANSAIGYGVGMLNGTLVFTNPSNNLVVSVKTLAGADPSASDPVYFLFRDATAGNGDYVVRQVTSALSIQMNATAGTMGFSNATPGRIWVVAFDNGGTVVLGLINCLSISGGAVSIYPLSGDGIASTVQYAGATSAQNFYTPNGVSALVSKAYRVLGYMTWEAGLTTAGTWNAAPTWIQLYRAGVKLPGDVVQAPANFTGAVATGTTAVPNDDTIPQNTEGNQYMSQAITPTSAANVLEPSAQANLGNSAGTDIMTMALYQDSGANALAVAFLSEATNGAFSAMMNIFWRMLAGTTSSTTFKIMGGSSTGTTTFNGISGARKYGGTLNSYMVVKEIMA